MIIPQTVNRTLKSVMVSYEQQFHSNLILERKLISSIEDMEIYFAMFPERKTAEMMENMRRDLRIEKVLIINTFGGYSPETKTIKIVKHL